MTTTAGTTKRNMVYTLFTSTNAETFIVTAIGVSLFLESAVLSTSIITLFFWCLIARILSGGKVMIDKTTALLLSLPVALFMINLIWVAVPGSLDGFTLVIRRFPLLIIPVAFVLAPSKLSNRQLQVVLNVFVLACLVASSVCLIAAGINIFNAGSLLIPGAHHDNTYFFTYDELTRIIELDPIYMSILCNLALLICIYSTLIKSNFWKLLLVVYFSIFIFLLASKLGILIFAGTIGVVILTNKEIGRKAWIPLLVLVPLILVGIFTLPFLKTRFKISTEINYAEVDSNKWSSATFRLAIWSSSMATIMEKPVLGHGTGGGQPALEAEYHRRNFHRGFTDFYNPHSEFLYGWLDFGLTGVLILVAIIAAGAWAGFKRSDYLFICFMAIIASSFAVECIFSRQKGIVYFALFYSMLAMHPRVAEHATQAAEGEK